jgi:calcineurin-like phosphoesterase family protein
MSNVFLVSDTHFGHQGVCRFLRNDGSKLRPWDNANDMDEAMVELWNNTVGPKDKVYHLGDVVINRRALSTLARLNGDKVLIKGNHDIFRLDEYTAFFRDIRAYHIMDKYILSHVPVHESQLARWDGNVHGHLHSNSLDDLRYLCVCVEQTEFKPIPWETVREQMKQRKIQYDSTTLN